MNERKLRTRLRWIVRFGAPLSLLATACGGATEASGGNGGAAGTPAGGAPSGGTGTGGTGAGGTGAGGLQTGGTATGGIGSGGTGRGGTGSGGAHAGGASSGGTGSGGAQTGGSANCTVGQAGIGSDCINSQTYEVDATCAVPELTTERCKELCRSSWAVTQCLFSQSTNVGKVLLICPPTCVAGRRPAGFVEAELESTGVAAYFARMAELEAAAVPAFRHLRAELHEQGAPRSLLRALSRAARDERRHARAVTSLARRHGGRIAALRVPARQRRSLEAIAIENVAEGCVRELFGALVATFQAEHAKDLEVRRVLRRIAHEETRHAALSMQVQSWLEQRLDQAARKRVQTARARALAELNAELAQVVEPTLGEATGLPSESSAKKLYGALFGEASLSS